MPGYWKTRTAALASAAISALCTSAQATDFNIPGGDLKSALDAYSRQAGISLLYPVDEVKGIPTKGAQGELTSTEALTKILTGTGFRMNRHGDSAVTIVRDPMKSGEVSIAPMQLAQATPSRAAVETVTVTSSKLGGADVQSIPIAITALSQEQLTATQTAGGPDLVKQVPNLTFTKTNFTGYSIQIRGIGTQAISVTTDPAVAVALNDTPFIRNHFFEQEFYDLSQVEVLRGPQGTLYGRNATAGVVNLTTAKPTDQFEAMASADIGNFKNRRFEGMVNIPIDDDRLDIRVAGEWTKRDGYTVNKITGDNVDGRNLWSSRVTIGWKPLQSVQAYLVWEHFQENDDRMRTAKQLCHSDSPTNHPGLLNVRGVSVPIPEGLSGETAIFVISTGYLSQGCLPASLYSPQSFQVPYGFSLPYVAAGWIGEGGRVTDPYADTAQSRNLRVIETQINPRYTAKNDTVEFNVDYDITPSLTFTSQTGFNEDFLFSTEDYNRFNTAPDIFAADPHNLNITPDGNFRCSDDSLSIGGVQDCPVPSSSFNYPTGYFCDPQLGCSSRLVVQDISRERAWQLSQEFRLASNFKGPFNFSVGGNYMHYETVEDYFVFGNTLSLFAIVNDGEPPGHSNECLTKNNFNQPGPQFGLGGVQVVPLGFSYYGCAAVDPNSLLHVNSLGHNYFLSRNPYVLSSYAGFGEAYYDVTHDLKLTGGIRWTDDKKHFVDIPSELLVFGSGYPSLGSVDQQWKQLTGRLAANWMPKLAFTDQTLVYGSWSHGYKAGGANPPGANLFVYNGYGNGGVPAHPMIFNPEFVDAYELGTKNTMLDGGLTMNGDVFFYNYKGYQISEIVDRTSINLNFDATVRGAELEASYEPIPGLKFNFAGGYEDTRIKNGQSAIDLMDRTAGHAGWMVMKPFVTAASNCIFPDYVVAALTGRSNATPIPIGSTVTAACEFAYDFGDDPVTDAPYNASTNHNYGGFQYTGYDPLAGTPGDPYNHQNTYNGFDYGPVPNNGQGFAKDVGGNELPNAPHFTVSASAEYTLPITPDWAGTMHIDYYWQDYSWSRVFNDNPYDRIRGYTNVNLALILTSQNGWQVMGYLKNVFDTTAITGAFLNSDDSGLTTNVFLTDPRLFGVRVTKNW